MSGFQIVSTQQSLIGGYIPVNYIDLDAVIDWGYNVTNIPIQSLDKTIDGYAFLFVNPRDKGDNLAQYNDFVNKYFPLQYKWEDFPRNNIGSPTFRFSMGDDEHYFCYSTDKFTGSLEEHTHSGIIYKGGISPFNFDDSKNYLPDYTGSDTGYLSEWYGYYTRTELTGDAVSGAGFMLVKYNDRLYFGFSGIVPIDVPNYNLSTSILYSVEDLGLSIESDDFDSEQYGEESTEGGYNVGGLPSFDDSSVSIGIPADPNISVSNLGFLNTYKVTSAGLEGMLNELFPDEPLPIIPQPSEGGFLSDVAYSINALSSTVGNLFTSFINSNLMQYVVDVHAIPVSPDTVGSANVKIGFKELQTTAQKVIHDYVTVDCGSLSLDEFRKNFTDYALCKYQLYLPFVGVVPIQPSLFLGTGGKINVTYKFNIIDGSFTAFISCTSSKSKLKNSVVGQYSGNCCVHIPITTNSYSNIVSGLVSGVSHSISAVEGSKLNVSGGADELMSAVGSTMTQPAYNLSNGYNATSSFMGVRTPYFIISRPVQSFSAEYPHEKGLPLNVAYRLSQLVGSGFTVCDSPHIDIECSEYERAEIERALTTGIVL